jgi:hypothetical protein
MTGDYPTYRGFPVQDDQHWVRLRHDTLDDPVGLLRRKRAKLAKAPEDNCRGPETRTTGVIGGNPPPQPPSDPVIPSPNFIPVQVPPRPSRFCSIDEKFNWLTALSKQREDMIENEKRAWTWAQALMTAISSKRGDTSALRALHSSAIAQREAYLALYRQAEKLYVDVRDNMEVEKCDGDAGKEIGMLPGNNGASVSIAGGVGDFTIPHKPYIALEDGGDLRLGAADVKRTTTIATLLLGLSYDLDFVKLNFGKLFGDPLAGRIKAIAEIESYEADITASGGTLTTTTEGVGIPGTGDPMHASPAGYFLADPALNDISEIAQRYQTSFDGLRFGLAQEQHYQKWSNTITLGGQFGRLETSDRFSGSIPGYARDFAYQTDLETAVWGLFVATDAEVSLDNAWDNALRYAGEFSGFRVAAGARVGVNFLSADGQDRLNFTGFAPQSIDIAKDDTTLGYSLSAGLKYTPPSAMALTLSLGASYGQDDIHPVASRSGETGDRTEIEFQEQEIFVGTVRSTIRF